MYSICTQFLQLFDNQYTSLFVLKVSQVAFVDGKRVEVHYVQHAFRFEPHFGITSINFIIKDLLTKTVHTSTI